MISDFLKKSGSLRLFTFIYLLPFIFGCLLIKAGLPSGFLVFVLGSLCGSLIWIRTLGLWLYQMAPLKNGLNRLFFNISTLVLIPGFTAILFLLDPENSFMFLAIPILSIVHIYTLYFFAKSLTSLEFKRSVGFFTYCGTMIFISALPIGIFILQPKIQAIVKEIEQ
jgi:hypothetical protein